MARQTVVLATLTGVACGKPIVGDRHGVVVNIVSCDCLTITGHAHAWTAEVSPCGAWTDHAPFGSYGPPDNQLFDMSSVDHSLFPPSTVTIALAECGPATLGNQSGHVEFCQSQTDGDIVYYDPDNSLLYTSQGSLKQSDGYLVVGDGDSYVFIEHAANESYVPPDGCAIPVPMPDPDPAPAPAPDDPSPDDPSPSPSPDPAPQPGPSPDPGPSPAPSPDPGPQPGPSPGPAPVPGQWPWIAPRVPPEGASDLCVDIPGGDFSNGAMLWLWDCYSGDNQKWSFQDGQLVSLADTTKCVDLLGGDTTNGNLLGLWDCYGGDSQQWGFDKEMGTIYLASSATSDATKCMALGGYKAGDQLMIWDCLDDPSQKWDVGSASVAFV